MEMKRKIYWCIQQLEKIGGTEMVTLQIIRFLADEYEIHVIPFDEVDLSKIKYNVPDNVYIENIGFPKDISQVAVNVDKNIKQKHFFKALSLIFKSFWVYTFGRFEIRQRIANITSKDDIIIISSGELMMFAPKNRFVIQHFHFNSKLYNSISSKSFRLLSKKPDFIIFLSESTQDKIKKHLDVPSTTIPNPCRFLRQESYEYHRNSLISVCRLEYQKDPMLMLKIAKDLDNLNFDYSYHIYGNGTYKNKMMKYIKKHHLSKVQIIEGISDLSEYYKNSDLYIMTSRFEGLPLTGIEANSLSLPIIWMDIDDPTSSFMIEGQNGYIIPKRNSMLFAKKIIEVLNDKSLLQELKKTSFASSERFMQDNIKQKWIETLDFCFDSISE